MGGKADLNCTNPAGCVQTSEISDGAVTNSKLEDWSVSGSKIVDFSITDTKLSLNAVSTDKIADGAITDTKITGPISTAKIEKPANVVVVAKSGGDFTSIQAAVDFVNQGGGGIVKVMPGTYTETVTIGYYPMELQGSGPGVTIIQSPSPSESVIRLPTILASGPGVSGTGVSKITGFTITGGSEGIIHYGGGCYDGGCYAALYISGNRIINNGYGIYASFGGTNYPELIVKDNTIMNNSTGIYARGFPVRIEGNTITTNIGNGIEAYGRNGYILHNTVTGNLCDIVTGEGRWIFPVQEYTYYNVSSNVADCISGDIGAYNIKSNGTPMP